MHGIGILRKQENIFIRRNIRIKILQTNKPQTPNMKRFNILLIIVVVSVIPTFGQRVSLVFLGDIMGHEPQINSAKRDSGRYDYTECFQYVEPYFRSGNICAGNLEVTLGGVPYTGYPTFSSPDALLYAVHGAGINMLVTANNHSCDRSRKGIENTIHAIDKIGIPRTGTFLDSLDKSANHPLLLLVNGVRLAFLNYTYGTNGLPVPKPNIVNHIDTVEMKTDIEKAKLMKPDKIIVLIHWGDEYQTTPNKSQTDLAKFLHSSGVDIIIGSHPHVIQPMHLTTNRDEEKLVVYSLGNFISNQRKPYTDGGAMIRVELAKHRETTIISNVEYMLTWVHTPIIDGRKKFFVLPASMYDKKGTPDSVPKGYEGMSVYLRLAREVMKANKNVNEIEEEWKYFYQYDNIIL